MDYIVVVYCMLLPFAAHSIWAHTGAVEECPGRSVPQLRADATHFELSLLFYYVSWSSDARQARLAYDGVAHYYHDYAYFGAIDCWHLQCNCSRTHRPAHGLGGGYPEKWPTLIVHLGRQTIQYQGSWHFEDLTRFLNHVIQPIDRVHNSGELDALRRISDAVVLALLDSPDSLAYKRFVAAAVRWLELDPERNIRYTVALGPSAKGMLKSEHITLPQLAVIDSRNVHTYNGTKGRHWQSLDLLRWVRTTLKGMALLADGYGTPMTIAVKARLSPVLAMGIKSAASRSVDAKSFFMGEDLTGSPPSKDNAACEIYWQLDAEDNLGEKKQRHSLLQMPAELYTSAKELQPQQLATHCYQIWQLNRATLINYYRINSYLNFLWSQHVHQRHFSVSSGITASRLLALHGRNRCLALSQHGTPALKIGIAKLVTKYGQLIWQHSTEYSTQNRSLGVVLFDAVKYRDYLQQLGIGRTAHQLKTEATSLQIFIVDVAQEALYVMPQQQTFSYLALKEFIKQFYARQLPRLHRSAPTTLPSAISDGYIHTYNRQLLLQALQRQNATNVVLMHRTDCALSAVLSQVLVQVAAMLRSPALHFVRFNSQDNDLPWELSMDVTPALLVFPQARPTESVVFPIDVKADVQNVFAFILAQLEPELQLRLVLSSCRRRVRHVRSCLDFARTLVLQHVSQYLKYWEIFEKERDLILSYLKQFNEIHIAIESSIRL
ncbi:uncharacterized protein LOC115622683 [Scaptodrosophila lebanonensis]|uniref:Uncharacterized protein LOC115622683 n=1 Tax=Drosophila lebanonensis TaxID=7225 RepID=A0A6J2T6J4_DROLE|nr:uncharacterized protein LOC115622683 [Scaptodrosophila lebanonensis]